MNFFPFSNKLIFVKAGNVAKLQKVVNADDNFA